MSTPCTKEEIIEILLDHNKGVDSKLDVLLEKVGNIEGRVSVQENMPREPTKGYISGVASVGALIGAVSYATLKPIAKPMLMILMGQK